MQLRRNEIMTGLLVLEHGGGSHLHSDHAGRAGIVPSVGRLQDLFRQRRRDQTGRAGPPRRAKSRPGQSSQFARLARRSRARPRGGGQPRHRDQVPPHPAPGALPRFEVRIDIEVDRTALVYKNANVRLMTLGLLGETAIDISGGNDHSGKAEAGQVFVGNRVPGFLRSDCKDARASSSRSRPKQPRP